MIVQTNLTINCNNIIVVLDNAIQFLRDQSIQSILLNDARSNVQLSSSCIFNRLY